MSGEISLFSFINECQKSDSKLVLEILDKVPPETIYRYCSLDVIVSYLGKDGRITEPVDIWNVIRTEDNEKIDFVLGRCSDLKQIFDRFPWLYKIFNKIEDASVIRTVIELMNQ